MLKIDNDRNDSLANDKSVSSISLSSSSTNKRKRNCANSHNEEHAMVLIKMCEEHTRCYAIVKNIEKYLTATIFHDEIIPYLED